jgi:hypothetical protein
MNKIIILLFFFFTLSANGQTANDLPESFRVSCKSYGYQSLRNSYLVWDSINEKMTVTGEGIYGDQDELQKSEDEYFKTTVNYKSVYIKYSGGSLFQDSRILNITFARIFINNDPKRKHTLMFKASKNYKSFKSFKIKVNKDGTGYVNFADTSLKDNVLEIHRYQNAHNCKFEGINSSEL